MATRQTSGLSGNSGSQPSAKQIGPELDELIGKPAHDLGIERISVVVQEHLPEILDAGTPEDPDGISSQHLGGSHGRGDRSRHRGWNRGRRRARLGSGGSRPRGSGGSQWSGRRRNISCRRRRLGDRRDRGCRNGREDLGGRGITAPAGGKKDEN